MNRLLNQLRITSIINSSWLIWWIVSALAHMRSWRYTKLQPRTAELLLQEDLEIVSASQVRQELKQAEGPALHSHFSGNVHAGSKQSDALWWQQGSCELSTSPDVFCFFFFPSRVHLLMLRVQYASWSVSHGLLGTQGARKASWFL